MARVSRATLAEGKVVALPGAATRRPNNYRYVGQIASRNAAKAESPFPARYRSPRQREADKIAANLNAAGRSPELLILMLMVQAMPQETVTALVEKIAPGVVAGLPEAAQALAAIRASRMNVGQAMDLHRAMAELRRETGA